ncbi:hypothetical protein SAMN05421763_103299 [[Luteovulum] sphaeroides subsp. megalophilum]|uniref:hypothetical protein n=1 Tax=Cereibacter sphaeroides TaxID=1063 RepID=UPI000B70A279|nr:hypothetical protein [Cereibacter sphaeroides]SNS87212.1 hypothetical protein SAMN05421763_103299 [[Luteovulum] sphaeroides subsp. megalophilum]
MAHVHYDLDEVARKMRRMRDETLPQALAASTSELQRDGYLAQDRLFEAVVLSQIEMMRLVNEGRGDRFISMTLGVFAANVIINTLSACQDEALAMRTIKEVLDHALAAYAGAPMPGTTDTVTEVRPVPSGRA